MSISYGRDLRAVNLLHDNILRSYCCLVIGVVIGLGFTLVQPCSGSSGGWSPCDWSILRVPRVPNGEVRKGREQLVFLLEKIQLHSDLSHVPSLEGKSQVEIFFEVGENHATGVMVGKVRPELGAHDSGAKENDRTHWAHWMFRVPLLVVLGDLCQCEELFVFTPSQNAFDGVEGAICVKLNIERFAKGLEIGAVISIVRQEAHFLVFKVLCVCFSFRGR